MVEYDEVDDFVVRVDLESGDRNRDGLIVIVVENLVIVEGGEEFVKVVVFVFV
ncbi:hypothetical protein [Staphylococcus haemolyticus]|uniref:hypothetical protein n=1 Tax=Staphylococcus haemolyticus TaxID=1283 RepID=UPI0016432095|nr:hypothetical protein [Staphylococcus haemolyticus]